MTQANIRNFAIVAHIDHGKSTLADRLLEATGTILHRNMQEQVLDSNPIERERGITIKLAPVRMLYKTQNQKNDVIPSEVSAKSRNILNPTSGAKIPPRPEQISSKFARVGRDDKEEYILNLIDTPGHVDFSYEVSRSLAACEGAVLVVDAVQGIQAQTLAHMQTVRNRNLAVIPVINKIDLDHARVAEVEAALHEAFGFNPDDILKISAKQNINITAVLDAIVARVPPPSGNPDADFRSLVFTSHYDAHRGVIVYVRVVDGSIVATHPPGFFGFSASKASFSPVEIGVFTPKMQTTGVLGAGEVGYIATGLKDLSLARVGDTVTGLNSTATPLPGYKEPKPMVYLSFFPTDTENFLGLRESLDKLHLSDSSFTYKPHASAAIGKGFLCGFLGLLHAEVVKERLTREFDLDIIATAPTVEYTIVQTSGETMLVRTPEDFPDTSRIREIREPVMYTTIFTPSDTVGAVMQLCQEKRAEFVNLEYIGTQAKFTYAMPLSEMIFDFFDRLKSVSSGYASLDYEFFEFREVDAVKMDILLNHKKIDAFSQIVVREQAVTIGNALVEKLKDLIPKHQFQIPIQAAIGGKVVARSDVKSFRKDVIAKLYGGDRTRKDKLLDKQKKGKKKMRQFGEIEIPQEVFFEVYKK